MEKKHVNAYFMHVEIKFKSFLVNTIFLLMGLHSELYYSHAKCICIHNWLSLQNYYILYAVL